VQQTFVPVSPFTIQRTAPFRDLLLTFYPRLSRLIETEYAPSRKPSNGDHHGIKARHHEPPVCNCFCFRGSSGNSIDPYTSGNAAYNASKAAVKSLTEGLAYELRERANCNVTAHLFIPGWTFTALTSPYSENILDKPPGAWSPEETVLYMLDKVRQGDFYILVPDNETKREVDQLRIMWAAADVAEGRPALSRWHANWKALYEEYMREGLAQLE